MDEWPQDCKLSEEQAVAIINGLFERYIDGDPDTEGSPAAPRPKKLINRIMWNRAHFNNLPAAAPVIPEPYHEGYKFQTDRPRQVWSQLKARLIENPYTVAATTVTGNSTGATDRLEKVLQYGFQECEFRNGMDIMGDLADGQITLCYGVLHWRRADQFYPEKMKREYAPFPPQDEMGEWEMTPLDDRDLGLYRERGKRYDRRRMEERTRIGFPYHIEVLHPSSVLRLPDVSMEAGDAAVVHVRRMLVMDYDAKLYAEDSLKLSINESDQKLRIYREADAPPGFDKYKYSREVVIVNLWTRDECYEFASLSSQTKLDAMQWEYVKHFKHEWGRPPFAFATGFELHDPDPVLRFQPAIEGIYRIKPGYDRLMSLWMIIAEMTAIPVWYLEEVKSGIPKLTEDGRLMTFSRNSAQAEQIPAGFTLKKMEWTLKPEFLTAIEMFAEELRKSEPSTGLASFSASTQPWTARLEQQQQSIQPKMLLQQIVKAMRIGAESIAEDISRRDEPVSLAYEKGMAEVQPKDAKNARVYVNVDSVSASERFSKIEMGRQLLADPKVGLTRREFVEEYEGRPDATQVLLNRDVEAFFETYEKPQLMQKMLLARMGTDVTFNSQGQQFMDSQGNELSPSQVMGMKTGVGAGTTPASQEGGMRNPGMPEMAPLQTPGTVPVEGMR